MVTITVNLLRETITINLKDWVAGNGGIPNGVASGTVTVAAYVQPLSSNDSLQYMRDTSTEQWKVFCSPYTTTGATWDTSPKDTVTWNGTEYRISGTPKESRDPNGNTVLKSFIMELYTQ